MLVGENRAAVLDASDIFLASNVIRLPHDSLEIPTCNQNYLLLDRSSR